VTYPSPDHLLRHLAFDLEVVDHRRSPAPHRVVGGLTGAPEAPAPVGALTTVVDLLAGSLVGRVVAPDWMATADLALHLAGAVPPGEVVLDASVLRDGRSTVVVEALLTHGDLGPVGDAVLTFVRLPRREGTLDLSAIAPAPGERTSFGPPAGPREAYGSVVAQRTVDRAVGATVTEVVDRVRNSFGAVNGGVVAGVAATAGAVLGDAPAGAATRVVTDLSVHYLAQARTGPLTTEARAVRDGPAGSTVRVEVHDADRRCVVAHVGVA
jgi:uncharacterized protein (TIGR00369 family)